MLRTNEKLATTLVRLQGDSDFIAVKDWLQDSFANQLVTNIDLRGEESTRGQGYAEALRDILNVMKDPRTLAEKFKK